jgi:endonuclease YncB( thermonuclease family)
MENTPKFIPLLTFGRVIKVVAADTFWMASEYNKVIYRFKVKLRGVIAPSINSFNPNEQIASELVHDEVKGLLLGKLVEVMDLSYDTRGRLLAQVICGTLDVNKYLLNQGLVSPYVPGTSFNKKETIEQYFLVDP